jgi:Protein of unknown function (DUF2911)
VKQFFHIALLMMAVLTLGFIASASAQGALTLPPSGDNQHSINTQYIGPVALTIDYHSPNVHAPDGTDRRGKIWGTLVPYGLVNLGFGTCTECPWRGGANENTTFTTSYDVTVQGKPLKAGTYGVHFIPGETEWTIIFSNNSSSWGSFTYDPKEDALRVTAKPEKSDYHEWLTYEFTDRDVSQATLALKWEDLQLPFQIVVPNIEDVYIDAMAKELRNAVGFDYRNWVAAAQYCLNTKKHLDLGLKWAEMAVSSPSYGTEAFDSLIILAQLQEANGQTAEAAKTKEKALNHRTAGPVEIHTYARGLQAQKKTNEAIEVFFFNAKKYPGQWPTEVGLARAYSAKGDYKEALKHAQIALSQNPPGGNKQNVESMIKKLQQGQDIN